MTYPEIFPLGENAFLIRLSETLDIVANESARAVADSIGSAGIAAVTDVVPANSSVGVYFDRKVTSANEIEKLLHSHLHDITSVESRTSPREHVIPVVYDGPDLEDVARHCSLRVEEVMEIHSAALYNVFAVGFAPGFAYLGELDSRIAVPRRIEPRTRVPAGSVAIANAQTAIYPFATPGGWNLVGSTDVRMFDIEREPASLFSVGDKVRFTAR